MARVKYKYLQKTEMKQVNFYIFQMFLYIM